MTNPQQLDRTLIQQCLADGGDGVRQMATDVTVLAASFRQHDIGPANYGLAQLAQNLKALIVLVQELRAPVDAIEAAVPLPSDHEVEKLVSWLETLVSAQQTRDWLTVADVLEYDLEPELQNWIGRFDAVRQSCAA